MEETKKYRTWTGLAATNRPATPPPTTRPSGLAKETLIPPDLLLVPPLSLGMNEPDKESISNRPCEPNEKKIDMRYISQMDEKPTS